MYDTRKDLLDAFAAARDVFTGLLAGCTPEQAWQARGGDENWSVVEVMCHLRDAEERAIERTRAMRDQDDPFLPGYDQEQWARERNYAASDLASTLAAFLTGSPPSRGLGSARTACRAGSHHDQRAQPAHGRP
jgi:hypothetical protein